MFSGIVEEVGVVSAAVTGPSHRLRISASLVLQGIAPGDSIAVNGCCLTVSERSPSDFTADVMAETLRRTNLGALGAGDTVNLEASLALGDRIGGHIVTGHVDAVGTVADLRTEGNARWITVATPADVAALMAPRGSVAIDGISLTIVEAGVDHLTASLIPHTLAATTARSWSRGTPVNIEADLLARYVRRALEAHAAPGAGQGQAVTTTSTGESG
ncbi:MAG: riboflavin synthase [Candidatus Dormibacteria bacterium]